MGNGVPHMGRSTGEHPPSEAGCGKHAFPCRYIVAVLHGTRKIGNDVFHDFFTEHVGQTFAGRNELVYGHACKRVLSGPCLNAEHGAGPVVHGPYSVLTVENQNSLVQKFQHGILFLEQKAQAQLFGYSIGRGFHKTDGVVMMVLGAYGYVENADQIVFVENGRTAAAPVGGVAVVVFRTDDFYGAPFNEPRTYAVGAGMFFRGEKPFLKYGKGIDIFFMPHDVENES